ncbi:hypothetical protein Rsub_09247 [Raphidocelis subcapitata]|uniref:Transmembrane protein 208 n=1 Tax=Raphidocelis subcapitata TaxID=307507 RepID=A0A2V0P9B3_9CHLO|nr:hypothetical protein Rsub_09247 [Raphidocelis subcapitata]|eukprot:GBF96448.1 hypothetical protein Rsub_09247 [Raphidocelis subcapitata]
MAGEGAKRRLETNQRRLATLRAALLGCTLLYAAVRLGARRGTAGGWHWFGLVVTLAAHAFSYLALSAAAAPTYSATGSLLDGGGDLDKGAASVYHDVIYITCAVQALACLTGWAWWLYALLPAYGSYLLYTKVIGPAWSKSKSNSGGEDALDDKTRARLERADRRAERRRVKRF